jgi:hypothetical protein
MALFGYLQAQGNDPERAPLHPLAETPPPEF